MARWYNAFCAAVTFSSLPCQISKAGCWMARANENANAQGSRDLNLTFIAFKRAEASSLDCPPDKNATPGIAAGTARKRHFTMLSANPLLATDYSLRMICRVLHRPRRQQSSTDATFISLAQMDSIMNGKLRQLPGHFISTRSNYNCTN